jgi:hypothetical protein
LVRGANLRACPVRLGRVVVDGTTGRASGRRFGGEAAAFFSKRRGGAVRRCPRLSSFSTQMPKAMVKQGRYVYDKGS